ncbi:type II secretion system protein GspL [Aestuariibacter salexigens]|uniref:type II secretion system protein GspL n=1 Tax=Aestuariibacter salexigens TaxID=226010 RepID=UPI0004053291|nr:type II secretion system protein GspL [Aestuariibacter salexigens]
MEQLVVRLGADRQDPVYWIVWSSTEQEIIASGQLPDAGHLDTLSERAGQRPVTALVSGSEVLLKRVTMPARGGRKAIAAIPYMLEDELTGDINDQFFALGNKQGQQQDVAVVRREQMQRWKAMLDDAGLYCGAMLPDVLALPEHEGQWTILNLDQQLLVRQDSWQGMQGEMQWMLDAISYYAKRQEEPLKIASYCDHDLPTLANTDITQPVQDMPMKVLVQHALATPFNLLQGDFKVKKRRTNNALSQWRLAAILATVALLSTFVDKGIELQSLSSKKDDLTAQINTEVERGFPNLGPYRDLRRKLNEEMRSLEQGGSGVSMLVMLSQLADAFASSKVKPQTLRFDKTRAELRMQAQASNYEALERFKREAESRGFTVEQGAINNTDNQVVGSLAIRS